MNKDTFVKVLNLISDSEDIVIDLDNKDIPKDLYLKYKDLHLQLVGVTDSILKLRHTRLKEELDPMINATKALLVDKKSVASSEEEDIRSKPFDAVSAHYFANKYISEVWGKEWKLVNVNTAGGPRDHLGRFTGMITFKNQDETKQVKCVFKNDPEIVQNCNADPAWQDVFDTLGLVS